jgi:hypothetical protein
MVIKLCSTFSLEYAGGQDVVNVQRTDHRDNRNIGVYISYVYPDTAIFGASENEK